jgi:hypothetical protein
MNELQHTATATLAVLNHVQIGLDRIRTGNGSATLLPTLADQLRDAVQITERAQRVYLPAGQRIIGAADKPQN